MAATRSDARQVRRAVRRPLGVHVPQPVARDPGSGELPGDHGAGVVEKNRHLVVISEVTGRCQGADVDGVQVVDAMQVHDEPQRPDVR